MKLAVSYFYQIRNFKKNMIPVSTAMWDPKWYHANQGENFIFKDKRGILNGLRILPFHPGASCEGLCGGREGCEEKGPENCKFLKVYREQLEKLNLEEIMTDINNLANWYKEENKLEEEPIVVFIVYEAPNNPCSERWVLLDYFKDKGIECKELEYPIDNLDWIKEGSFDF